MKQYALVVPTSMGVRITPSVRQPVHTSSQFFMQATSAETARTVKRSSYAPIRGPA